MSKSKVASIRALQELKGIVQERKAAKFNPLWRTSEEECTRVKKMLSEHIEKQLEEYAVKQFAQYGVKIVPICHRSSSYKNSDIVRPELKVTIFDETAEKAFEQLKLEDALAHKKIEDWYFKAVQAVAEQCDIPPTPEF